MLRTIGDVLHLRHVEGECSHTGCTDAGQYPGQRCAEHQDTS